MPVQNDVVGKLHKKDSQVKKKKDISELNLRRANVVGFRTYVFHHTLILGSDDLGHGSCGYNGQTILDIWPK